MRKPYKSYDKIKHNGEVKSVAQWAAHFGVSKNTIYKRVNNGFSVDGMEGGIMISYTASGKRRTIRIPADRGVVLLSAVAALLDEQP